MTIVIELWLVLLFFVAIFFFQKIIMSADALF